MRGNEGGGWVFSANEYSCTHGAQINFFGDLTPYITYVLSQMTNIVCCCLIFLSLNICFFSYKFWNLQKISPPRKQQQTKVGLKRWHATRWLATRWGGAAAHWSGPNILTKTGFDPEGRDLSVRVFNLRSCLLRLTLGRSLLCMHIIGT